MSTLSRKALTSARHIRRPGKLTKSVTTFLVEPGADGVDRELGGVAGHAEADPAAVVGQIIDAVGHDLAELLVLEVMDLGPPRLAFGAVLGALVGIVADQLLLLGVDRDHRLMVSLES